MSERLSIQEAETRVPESARQERRKIRRVGVALQVRIRNAEHADGDFEEIRTTLNASKKAIYFFSPLNGYYKGMKLRITFPFDPQANANLEQTAEVIRVHRRGTGFGVALSLNPQSQDSDSPQRSAYAQHPVIQLAPRDNPPTVERRCATRTAFIAPVELIEAATGARIKARVADLSLHGCYVDTLNPLPVGSSVRLQIQRLNERLELTGTISSQHPGSGMGVEFSDVTLEQRTSLKNWLAESTPGAQSGFSNSRASRMRKLSRASESGQVAVKLINALVRKGILTNSEASELLSEAEE